MSELFGPGFFAVTFGLSLADFGWFLGIETFHLLGRPTFFDPQFFWRLRGLVSPAAWTDFRFPPTVRYTSLSLLIRRIISLTNARLQDLKSQPWSVPARNVIPPWFFFQESDKHPFWTRMLARSWKFWKINLKSYSSSKSFGISRLKSLCFWNPTDPPIVSSLRTLGRASVGDMTLKWGDPQETLNIFYRVCENPWELRW